MSTLSLRLPNSIHRHVKEIVTKEGVSINQFISSAVSEKISALMTEDFLQQKAKKADRKEFKNILAKVPSRKPNSWRRTIIGQSAKGESAAPSGTENVCVLTGKLGGGASDLGRWRRITKIK